MGRALWCLLLIGCYRVTDLSFTPPEGAQSLLLIAIDEDRIALRGLAVDDRIVLSLRPETRIYLLAFERSLAEVGLSDLTLAGEGDPGRPIPDPLRWSRGSREGFDPWTTAALPEEIAGVRLAGSSPRSCWAQGGCIDGPPYFCKLPCDSARVAPPAFRIRERIRPAPPDPPRLPRWLPEQLLDCGPGTAHFYEGTQCEAIGAPCPAGRFPADLPADAIYVDASAAIDGDGTLSSPRNRFPEDLVPGATVALAAGKYDLGSLVLPEALTIRGACNGTQLEHVRLADRARVRDVRLDGGFTFAGDVASFDGVEVVGGTVTSTGTVFARELVLRGADVRFVGRLDADRLVVKDVRRQGVVLYGRLQLRGGVVDGYTESLPAHAALTIHGSAEIRGLQVENVERLGFWMHGLSKTDDIHLEDVVVREVAAPPCPQSCDLPLETVRSGILLHGRMLVERVLVEESSDRAMLVYAFSSTITDLTLRDVRRGVLPLSAQTAMTALGAGTRFERIEIGSSPGAGVTLVGDRQRIDHLHAPHRMGEHALVVQRARGVQARWVSLPGPNNVGVGVYDAELDLSDVSIASSTVGIKVLAMESEARLTGARIEMVGVSDGVDARRSEIELADVRLEAKVGIASGHGASVTLRSVEIESVLPLVILDGIARVEDAQIQGTGPMAVGPDVFQIASRLELVRARITGIETLRVEENTMLRLEDVHFDRVSRAIECRVGLGEPASQLELVRVEIEGSEEGIIGDGCRTDITDLRIHGARLGALLFAEDETVDVRRFRFEDNEVALQGDGRFVLRDGSFTGNGVALSLERDLSPDQAVRVEMQSNDVDLLVE